MIKSFSSALEKVIAFAESWGIEVVFASEGLDEFFKGDLNGKTIWIADDLTKEEKLFNLLHLIGHTVQWGTDGIAYELGSKINSNPDSKLLAQLYSYEWEANCYGLFILEYIGMKSLKEWLYENFKEDLNYLMHYYRTGKKERILTQDREPVVELYPKAIPLWFEPIKKKESRGGIVIDFKRA